MLHEDFLRDAVLLVFLSVVGVAILFSLLSVLMGHSLTYWLTG